MDITSTLDNRSNHRTWNNQSTNHDKYEIDLGSTKFHKSVEYV